MTETATRSRLEDEYKHAMWRVASPVAVVTYDTPDGPGGVTCTAICSATTQPPTLVVCINRETAAREAMLKAGGFAVNFLTEGQSDIARQFSRTSDQDAQFSVGSWHRAASGAPVLEDAAGSFDCLTDTHMDHGAHTIFLGQVQSVNSSGGSGLLYRDGFFRRLAAE